MNDSDTILQILIWTGVFWFAGCFARAVSALFLAPLVGKTRRKIKCAQCLAFGSVAILIGTSNLSTAFAAAKAPVSTPEQARQRLADLKKNYSAADFLESAENGDTLAVTLFLQSGMAVDAKGKEGETAMMRAAGEGQIETMGLLLTNKANINATTTDGRTALIVAAAGGHIAAVKFLCDRGADVNAKSRRGLTPLYAAAFENHQEVVSYLLSKRADATQMDVLGNTAPLAAVQRGHYGILDAFLKNPSLLNNTNVAGFAVADFLRSAASSGDSRAETALEKLRAAGVSLLTEQHFLESKDGLSKSMRKSAANFAAQLSDGKNAAEPFTGLLSKYVLDFETNSFPVAKVSLLYLAAAEALGEARFAFASGFSSFGPSEAEKTAKQELEEAQRIVLRKYEGAIKAALQQPDFNSNMTDEKGRTPLQIIASTGNVDLAKALIEKGANPNQIDQRGETPLKAAERAGKPEMIALLGTGKK